MPRQTTTSRVPFLLSQLGAVAAESFAAKTSALGLSPNEAGVLRLLAHTPGMSQRELAHRLGTPPSRMVAVIDGLESKALLSRARSASDRRNYELTLTETGLAAMRDLRVVAEANEVALLGGLTDEERETLARVLARLAETLHLDADVHPAQRL